MERKYIPIPSKNPCQLKTLQWYCNHDLRDVFDSDFKPKRDFGIIIIVSLLFI